MLGEKLALHNIPFLFQEHTTMSEFEAIEALHDLPVSRVVGQDSGRIC